MGPALKPEDWIAHYRVVALLGAGGMGEVYRARDQSLERDVALKVLPPEVVTSEERVRRFTNEAKSASSLNHPHIVHIYEIGEDQVRGAPASAPLHYIAMELVQGETLSAKIHDKRNDLKTLLGWLAQAAEGVAKAHAAGVVHRDLKPGNIMISDDGYAKVLDFGLAKLTEAQAEGPGASVALTRTARDQTHEGVVLGTVGYMAPEQVRGHPVDARADVFAFGCMLYEAATHQRPFAADSNVETMHRILNDAPTPVEQLNAKVPAELRRLIRRCLAKDPNQRLDSMRTLALELREIVEEYDKLPPSSGSEAVPVMAQKPRSRVIALTAVGLLVAIAGAFVLWPKGPPRLNPNMRSHGIDVPLTDIDYPGLSPDGRWIALPARDERGVAGLYYMNVKGGEVRPIAIDSAFDVKYADISPDGAQVVYGLASAMRREIRVVPTLGGPPRTISRNGAVPRWRPDGQVIGFIVPPSSSSSQKYEFWTVRPDGSKRNRAFMDSTASGERWFGFAWAPDGKRIAWIRDFANSTFNEIVIHDLTTGRERQLTHDRKLINEAVWTPQGEIIFSSNRGGPSNLWITRSSGGPVAQVTRGAGPDAGIRVSADGRSLLYSVQQQLASFGWWNVETGESGRDRQDQPVAFPPMPSPDGQWIVGQVIDPDMVSGGPLVVMSRDGSGRRTVVSADEKPQQDDWSPDGRRIAWTGETSGDSTDLHILDVSTGETLESTRIRTRGDCFGLLWASEDTIAVLEGRGTAEYSISRRRIVSRSADMDFIVPSNIPGWTVVFRTVDSTTHPGLYVRPANGGRERFLAPIGWLRGGRICNHSLYCWPESLGFRRMDLPSGRLSQVAHEPPEGGDLFYPLNPDGREVFWFKLRETGKLVLVENLH